MIVLFAEEEEEEAQDENGSLYTEHEPGLHQAMSTVNTARKLRKLCKADSKAMSLRVQA